MVNKRFRIAKVREINHYSSYISDKFQYHIQELRKFLFFKPKWKTVWKENPWTNGGCGPVIFDTKKEAEGYLKQLKCVLRGEQVK